MNIAQSIAGQRTDDLIAREVAVQDKMWGDANERADAEGNQLLKAAQAQGELALLKIEGMASEDATREAKGLYPKDWNGFRDYGSNIANLVVTAAFLRSEIKRRILLGETVYRAPRTETYPGPDLPLISAEQALDEIDARRGVPHHQV